MVRTAIFGIGMTRIEANKKTDTFADMVWEAVNKALEDAGMTIEDVDNIITTSNDFWDGRTISCMAVSDASGAHNKNVSCVEGDGTFGDPGFYGAGDEPASVVIGDFNGDQVSDLAVANASSDDIAVLLGQGMVRALQNEEWGGG